MAVFQVIEACAVSQSFKAWQMFQDLKIKTTIPQYLQGEGLISKRYEINSRNPGGASFEKVAKAPAADDQVKCDHSSDDLG